MRIKTLILSAACGLLTAAAANADSVYSVNVVGYVNKSFTGGKYTMFGNPLNSANTVSNLFSTLTENDVCKIFIWDITKQKWTTMSFGGYEQGGWQDADGNDLNSTIIAPGQGAWFYTLNTVSVTFVGDVKTGSLSTTIAAGWTQVASQVPQNADLNTLGITPNDTDKIFKYNGTKWQTWSYSSGDGTWENLDGDPEVPTLDVAEGAWYHSTVATTWNRSFSIN